jgi:hypothetical protein
MHGRVVAVTDRTFTLSNPVYGFDPSHQYTLFGIKIWNPERQARVSWARNSVNGADPPTSGNDVPDATFDKDMYHVVYPDTRVMGFADTYLDYRTRWNRNREYRVTHGRDIVNMRDPNLSNLMAIKRTPTLIVDGTLEAAGGALYAAVDPIVSMCSNLTVTPTAASLISGITLAASNVIVTPCNVTLGPSTLVIDSSLNTARIIGSTVVADAGGVTMCEGALQVAGSNVVVGKPLQVSDSLSVCGGVAPIGIDAAVAVDGNVFTTGIVITQSDARAKCELRSIDAALDRVRELQGYTYASAKDPQGRRHTGLLAQDVARVMPEAVYGNPDTGSSVAYGNLAGLFVEAINNLADRVNDIEKKLRGDP